MKHFGDITKINGAEVPLVDIVTGGSPCQDLSVAGKRAGLDGERSGLFMEQIRIIKEMRNECIRQLSMRGANEPVRPRYMVWENVPGAFSSNKGEDFRCVLEETARIADKDAVIPGPPKGKWNPSGCIMGDGWSIAWRVHDAQFWGVPQRRKRIALVADFGGDTAPEILFERESVSGNTEESREQGQGTSTTSERNIDPSSYTLKIRGGVEVDSHGKKAGKGPLVQTELSGTLGVSQDQTLITKVISVDEKMGQTYIGDNVGNTLGARDYKQPQAVVYGMCSYDSNSMKSPNPHSGIYEAETTRTLDNNGGNPACNQGGMIVLEGNGQRDSHKGDGYKESETMYTLNTVEQHAVCAGFKGGQSAGGIGYEEEKSPSLVSQPSALEPTVVCCGVDAYNQVVTGDKAKSLTGSATDSDHIPCVTYQKTTGALTPGAHPGSYNGQDAYNDMLVVGGVLTEQ